MRLPRNDFIIDSKESHTTEAFEWGHHVEPVKVNHRIDRDVIDLPPGVTLVGIGITRESPQMCAACSTINLSYYWPQDDHACGFVVLLYRDNAGTLSHSIFPFPTKSGQGGHGLPRYPWLSKRHDRPSVNPNVFTAISRLFDTSLADRSSSSKHRALVDISMPEVSSILVRVGSSVAISEDLQLLAGVCSHPDIQSHGLRIANIAELVEANAIARVGNPRLLSTERLPEPWERDVLDESGRDTDDAYFGAWSHVDGTSEAFSRQNALARMLCGSVPVGRQLVHHCIAVLIVSPRNLGEVIVRTPRGSHDLIGEAVYLTAWMLDPRMSSKSLLGLLLSSEFRWIGQYIARSISDLGGSDTEVAEQFLAYFQTILEGSRYSKVFDPYIIGFAADILRASKTRLWNTHKRHPLSTAQSGYSVDKIASSIDVLNAFRQRATEADALRASGPSVVSGSGFFEQKRERFQSNTFADMINLEQPQVGQAKRDEMRVFLLDTYRLTVPEESRLVLLAQCKDGSSIDAVITRAFREHFEEVDDGNEVRHEWFQSTLLNKRSAVSASVAIGVRLASFDDQDRRRYSYDKFTREALRDGRGLLRIVQLAACATICCQALGDIEARATQDTVIDDSSMVLRRAICGDIVDSGIQRVLAAYMRSRVTIPDDVIPQSSRTTNHDCDRDVIAFVVSENGYSPEIVDPMKHVILSWSR